jgi:hypothetical protein
MRGEDPVEVRKVARSAPTFAELAADYLERHAVPKKRPKSVRDDRAMLALAEALSWLVSQGLLLIDPNQPAHWYVLTRRGRNLRSRADVEAYRKGRDAPR